MCMKLQQNASTTSPTTPKGQGSSAIQYKKGIEIHNMLRPANPNIRARKRFVMLTVSETLWTPPHSRILQKESPKHPGPDSSGSPRAIWTLWHLDPFAIWHLDPLALRTRGRASQSLLPFPMTRPALLLLLLPATFAFHFQHKLSSSVHPCDDFSGFVCNFADNPRGPQLTNQFEKKLNEDIENSGDPVFEFIKEELEKPEYDAELFEDGQMVGKLVARGRIFDPQLQISKEDKTFSLIFATERKLITCVFPKCPSFVQGTLLSYLKIVDSENLVNIEELTVSAQLNESHLPEGYGRPVTQQMVLETIDADENLKKYMEVVKWKVTVEKYSERFSESSKAIQSIFETIREEIVAGIQDKPSLSEIEKSDFIQLLQDTNLSFEQHSIDILTIDKALEDVKVATELATNQENLSKSVESILQPISLPEKVPTNPAAIFVSSEDIYSISAALPRGLKFGILTTRFINKLLSVLPTLDDSEGFQCYSEYFGSLGVASIDDTSNRSTLQYPDGNLKAPKGLLDVEGARAAVKVLLKERPFVHRRPRRSVDSQSVSVLNDLEWFFVGATLNFCDVKTESEILDDLENSPYPRSSIRGNAMIRQIVEFEEIFQCAEEDFMSHSKTCSVFV
uniref:Peptidase_M13 domain-containing protein n=1 Tax=Steinernema glaseri TaxID=37863 RepID=A0A1I8AD49_9BILA